MTTELEQKDKTIASLHVEIGIHKRTLNKQWERIKMLCFAAGHTFERVGESVRCKSCPDTLGWHCSASPITVCQYNVDEDPACDSCVWCGDPSERK
ncbi:MAG: hypothetical protein K2Y22_14530 [Candidatus Obscuribacterales bacterium]|nr:hypothetical protein [Candidatus Obscuribacterales bacterium]